MKMSVVYVREQGAVLTKRGERIVAIYKGEAIFDHPVYGIDNIAIFGNVQVSTAAAAMLMEKGVDICFFSYSG